MGVGQRRGAGQILLRMLFLLYSGLMLWLLFGQRVGAGSPGIGAADNWNLIPLKTIKLYLDLLTGSTNGYLVRHAAVNLLGNVILFIPLGYFLPGIFTKLRSFFRCFFWVLLVITAVETVQLATQLGSCDVDDLLLNLPGAMIGYGIWKLTAYSRR